MKIIVDKIPETPRECSFSQILNCSHPNCYICACDELGLICEDTKKCDYLKPISDYAAEKPSQYYNDRTGQIILGCEPRELFNLIDIK